MKTGQYTIGTVYAVGDVQGCYGELARLLDTLKPDPADDEIWIVGDLVNRGPRSLDVLRLVAGLGDAAVVVLGNHDLHLLAAARGHTRLRDQDQSLRPVLEAHDRQRLLDWLQSRPVLHHDESLGVTVLHAGLPPQWDIALARHCAAELERALRGEASGMLFAQMYGNQTDLWRDDLAGPDRLRFITNALTRLRACDSAGRMLLGFKGPPTRLLQGAVPWFRAAGRRSAGARIVCGHWSALGYVDEGGVLCIDTGCIWGGTLAGQRIDGPSAPVFVPSTMPAVDFSTA